MAFVFGEFIAVHDFTWGILILPIVLLVIKIITKQQVAVFVVIFLFSVLGFLLMGYELEKRDSAYALEEKQVEIKGEISKITENQYGFQVYLQNVELEKMTLKQIIVYTVNIEKLKIGNTVYVSGKVKQFSVARNCGNFDSRAYYMSLGIYIGIEAKEIQIVKNNYDFVRQNLYKLKNDIEDKLEKVCNWNSRGILKILREKNTIYEAVLLGNKTDMDMEIKELYSISGISHILAISGLHISIIGMFIYTGIRRYFSFGMSASASVIIVVMFGILSGMGIAAIRALIMFGLKLLGEVRGRNYDYITAISLAGIMLFMRNPFIIYNSGFQMSFAAIISIGIVWNRIAYILQLNGKREGEQEDRIDKRKKILWRMGKRIKKALLFSMTISIFMNPIVAYYYFALPTYSFLLNIIIVPLMSVVVVSGIMGIGLSYISVSFSRLAIFPGCMVLEIYEKMCNITLKFPFASVIVGKPDKAIIFVYYPIIVIFIVILVQIRKRKRKERKKRLADISHKGMEIHDYIENRNNREGEKVFSISLMFLVILLEVLLYGYFPVYNALAERNQLVITAMDVGQGDGIVLKTPDHKVITIDGGSSSVDDVGRYRIMPFLKSQCIKKVDYAIMTHADQDHISGLIEMMEVSDGTGIQVKHLVLPDIRQKDESYLKMVRIAREHGVEILYITKGNCLKFDKVEVKCIYPGVTTQAEDRNSYSTVLDVTYNKFSMLLTGDISSECEVNLENMLKSHYTVLKVAHHGSKYSTSNEFLQQINPKYSVISVGEHNLYGHPSKETIERLEQNGSQILRTDKSGEITISTDGESMEINAFINE